MACVCACVWRGGLLTLKVFPSGHPGSQQSLPVYRTPDPGSPATNYPVLTRKNGNWNPLQSEKCSIIFQCIAMKRRYVKSAWTKKQWLIFLDMLFLGVLGLCESSLKFRFTPNKWPPALLKIQFLWSEPRGSFLVVWKQSQLSYDLREAKHSALWVDSPTAQWASAAYWVVFHEVHN